MNANQLPDADDFSALSEDIRKRRYAARLPELKAETVTPEHVEEDALGTFATTQAVPAAGNDVWVQPSSGCGPGLPVAADTPQHGVRSVLMRERAKLEAELWDMLGRAYIQPRRTPEDYKAIAWLAQGIADRAHLIAGKF